MPYMNETDPGCSVAKSVALLDTHKNLSLDEDNQRTAPQRQHGRQPLKLASLSQLTDD